MASTAVAARAMARVTPGRLAGLRLLPFSLSGYVSDPEAPLEIVLCPPGRSVEADLAFLRNARRILLWPPPAAEIWNAIAGLRGSHDSPPASAPASPRATGRQAALLLERDVTLDRARRAVSSGAPRDWIVERVQRVRIAPKGLEELERLGVRWSVLEPVEIVALLASPSLARARARWGRLLPDSTPVWPRPIGDRTARVSRRTPRISDREGHH